MHGTQQRPCYPSPGGLIVLRVVARRLLLAVPLVFLVSVLTFVLVALTPGDPAYTILGSAATPQQVAALDKTMGFNLPVWVQYWHWLDNALHGNFGSSFISGLPVTSIIASRLPVTLSLVIGGTLLGATGGVLLGIFSAVRSGPSGRVTEVLQMLGIAVPNFWLGLILIEVFAVKVHLFPATGYVSFSASPGQWLRSLVLPLIALSVPAFTGIAKQTRDGIRDAMSRDYVRMLRACGTPEWRIVYIHALRNAAIPVLTFVGLLFITLVSGTVFVESVFAMPGIGGLAQTVTTDHDLAVIQGVAIVYCLVVVAANLLTDLAYGWVNPKARTS
jgi:peptide/nickel transport system permease protein